MHKQLGILRNFINSFDFVKMRPDNSVIKGGVPDNATALALVERGRAYAIYINGDTKADLMVALPTGKYKAEWLNTKTGRIDKTETFEHSSGHRLLGSPTYKDDIALRISRCQ